MTSDPRVLIVAPNWLGDAVMALPAIADLRRHFADARLIIAARPGVAALFGMVPGVEQVVAFPATGDPAIAILLPNSFSSAWRVWRAGVPERWGYARDARSRLLTRAVGVPRPSMHQGRYYQHLVAGLGIPTGSLQPAVDVPAAARDEARQLLASEGWDGRQPLVVIAAGAAYGTAKRWLPSHFAQLIGDLARTEGARSVLVGSAADAETMTMILANRAAAGHVPIDLTGRTTLPVLAGVLALARACVSNDSGAMHLAGAIGTPLVALFGPTREAETAPLTRAGGRAEVLAHPVWCRPCMLRECPIDHRCMRGLVPARVLAGVRSVLA